MVDTTDTLVKVGEWQVRLRAMGKIAMAIETQERRIFLACAICLFCVAAADRALSQTRMVRFLRPVAVETPQPVPSPSPCLTLEELENLALANNPTIAGANALVMQQQGVLRQAGLYPNPTVGYVRSDPNQPGQSQTQGVFVSQDLVTGGKLRIAQQAARQDVEHSVWQLEAQHARVLNDVRIRFQETLGAQQAVLAAIDLEKIALEGVKMAEKLLDAKIGTRPDVLQAEIQLSAEIGSASCR